MDESYVHERLKNHINHRISCKSHDNTDIQIECEDCHEILISSKEFENEFQYKAEGKQKVKLKNASMQDLEHDLREIQHEFDSDNLMNPMSYVRMKELTKYREILLAEIQRRKNRKD